MATILFRCGTWDKSETAPFAARTQGIDGEVDGRILKTRLLAQTQSPSHFARQEIESDFLRLSSLTRRLGIHSFLFTLGFANLAQCE